MVSQCHTKLFRFPPICMPRHPPFPALSGQDIFTLWKIKLDFASLGPYTTMVLPQCTSTILPPKYGIVYLKY